MKLKLDYNYRETLSGNVDSYLLGNRIQTFLETGAVGIWLEQLAFPVIWDIADMAVSSEALHYYETRNQFVISLMSHLNVPFSHVSTKPSLFLQNSSVFSSISGYI